MATQNEITTPVQPRQDNQNFRDMRPAADIIANPIEGHDYSYHPQAQAIQQGLAMRRLNAGQAAGGMRIGAPAPAPQQPGNVGVVNAYAQPNLPEPGRMYSGEEASRLAVPRGWGTGEITMGGQTSHMFTSPEQIAASQARQHANGVQASRDRAGRANQMALDHLSSQMDALMNEYYGGRASLDQVAQGQAALSQFAGSYLANDAARHQADAERAQHFDPRSNPAYMAATINQMNANAERDRAEAGNHDPRRRVELLDMINSNPQRRATALAMQGVDPATIGALPAIAPNGQQVNAANIGQRLQQDHNRSLGELVTNQDMPLDELFARASQFPGFGDRHSETRQLFDQAMADRFAGHADEWAKQWYVPPEPSRSPLANGLSYVGSAAASLLPSLFGDAPPAEMFAHPFDQQGAYDRARRRVGLMMKYNINPSGPIGVNKESS